MTISEYAHAQKCQIKTAKYILLEISQHKVPQYSTIIINEEEIASIIRMTYVNTHCDCFCFSQHFHLINKCLFSQ